MEVIHIPGEIDLSLVGKYYNFERLNYIKNDRIKRSAEKFLDLLPDYFFTVAASSTGKYHPAFASGEGGLVRHSKVACYILNEIVNTTV